MTSTIAPAYGPASRTGVRRSGDNFQDVITWARMLQTQLPGSAILQVETEINDAGSVDDVVLRMRTGPHRYASIKWATGAGDPLNSSYLMKRSPNGRSILEKLFASWGQLRHDDVPAELEFITNRAIDPDDALLSACDGNTDKVMPAAALAGRKSKAGIALQDWCQHLGAPRDEVLAMLEHLTFHPGRRLTDELTHALTLMTAVGLRADEEALLLATAKLASWIRMGRRIITTEEIAQEIDNLGLRVAVASETLLVQAIDRDLHPDDATVAVDWVDLFDGGDAPSRRRPVAADGWERMAADLDVAVAQLRDLGATSVLVRGAMRLGTFFTVGARLGRVTGMDVKYLRNGELWSSTAPRRLAALADDHYTDLGYGDELAVAFGMTIDPTPAVLAYLRTAGIPVRGLLTLSPDGGAHDQSVRDPGHAVSLAQQLRDRVRAHLDERPAARIHLFQAGPAGLALLTGHRWNRVAPTVVYEDLGPGAGYTPAFTVTA